MTIKLIRAFVLFLKKFWMTILLNVVILFLCFMNSPDISNDLRIRNFDKIVHFLMFLALSGVVFFDSTRYLRRKIPYSRIFFASFLYPTLFSGLIEILQEYFSPFRTGDWVDFLFDGIGTFAGIVICFIINSKLPFNKTKKLKTKN